MIFNRLSQLLHQANKDGVLIKPLPESTFQVSIADRRWLLLAGWPFWTGLVLLYLAASWILFLVGLSFAHSHQSISKVLKGASVIATLFGECLIFWIFGKIEDLIRRSLPWLTTSNRTSLQLCTPLSKGDCITMLELFKTVEGGQDYHQKILNEGRPVYGFDHALLQRVYAFQQRRERETNRQRASERLTQQEEDACREIHGIV